MSPTATDDGRGDANDGTDPETAGVAEHVRVSFRPPESDPGTDGEWWVAESSWIVERMDAPSYRRYLHRAHAGPVAVGDEWDEFVNCGCASPEDVLLRVEEVVDGDAIGPETTIEVAPRDGPA
jgi:hypothetical protein